MTPVFENIKLSRRSLHLIFWVCWVFSFTYIKSIGYSGNVYVGWLMYYILTLPVFLVHTYLIAYWLIPGYLLKKKYVVFFVILTVLLLLFSVIELLISNELIFGKLTMAVLPETNYLNMKNVFISGVGNHYIIILFLSVKLMKNWFSEENRKNEAEKETVEAEMKLLTNQLQPKFILSTIDSLEKVATEKPEKTPDLIVRISNLLNNLLVGFDNKGLTLKRELYLLESYFDIQKHIKYFDLHTQVFCSGGLDTFQVPALIFFPVIEQILLVYGNSVSNQEIKVFGMEECNKVKLLASFKCDNNSIGKLDEIILKTNNRLSFYYGSAYTYSFKINDNRAELHFEFETIK